jgi:hypothetical protein
LEGVVEGEEGKHDLDDEGEGPEAEDLHHIVHVLLVRIGFVRSPTLLAIVHKHSEYKPGYDDDPRTHEKVLEGGKKYDLVVASAQHDVKDEVEVDDHEANDQQEGDYHQGPVQVALP